MIDLSKSQEILENLDTSRLKEPKKYKKRGEIKESKHLGVYRTECEVIGHSWEYLRGQNKGETTMLFGRKMCDRVFPPKVAAVVHIIAVDGKRRQITVNDLTTELKPETAEAEVPMTKKVKAVNDGRRVFKVGSTIPVMVDVWDDGYCESYLDRQACRKRFKDAKKPKPQ